MNVNIKKKLLNVSIIILIILIFFLIAVVLKEYFLAKGVGYFDDANKTFSEKVFQESLEKAISNLKLSILCNKLSVFNHTNISKAYYKLGLSNLYLRKNNLARIYLENAKRTLSKKDNYVSIEELEAQLIQSLVKVEGIIGDNEAIVNGNIVKEEDLVSGITVLKITKNYILFKINDIIFSDSFDKYNPLVKRVEGDCRNLFNNAQNDNMGFARDYYLLAKLCSKDVLRYSYMDSEQSNRMKKIIDECENKIAGINAKIDEAKKSKKIIIGMNKNDVISILGEPLKKIQAFEMDYDEKWIYSDKILYFKQDLNYGIEKKLIRIE